MAGALVGGAFLSATLQVLFDRLASREVVSFIRGQKLSDALLKKLDRKLVVVHAVINDAEVKQFTNQFVKKWLLLLKEAVYEAEDILDEIAIEALRHKMEAAESQTSTNQVAKIMDMSTWVRDPFDSQSIESRVKEIIDRLEDMAREKDDLGLKEGVGEKALSQRWPSTSLVDESLVYGRDDEKEKMIELVLSDNASSTYAIVGMGGAGKTTLAQLLYNDQRVKEHFDLKAWVCVSEDFNPIRITKMILEEITRSTVETNNLNQLQVELKEKINMKKFLLVLDDVWNEDSNNWALLQTPLIVGAKGSKIVVTTRSTKVAAVMRAVYTHRLGELSSENSWSLFIALAFVNGDSSAYPQLEAFGKKIVDKCQGLPLAIKAVGSLLHSEVEARKWDDILNNQIWNMPTDTVLPALRLSYYYLPSHLKRCFAYCSIFPKDYELKKEKLILLWMAEGLLEESEGKRRMEEVGDLYFDELLSKSFFQNSVRWKETHFVMHDLIHDLAQLVYGESSTSLEKGRICQISEKTRHLSYSKTVYDTFDRFGKISEFKCLRTFLSSDGYEPAYSYLSTRVLHILSSEIGFLRVLCLCNYAIIDLPHSIGKLKHLRYLDLSSTRIEKLPTSICSLYNLQTLLLSWCDSLNELPLTFKNLINLHYLDIRGVPIKEIPSHIGHLKCLQKLSNFIVGQNSGSGIGELKELSNLKGTLEISKLQNVKCSRDAMEANLKDKRYLDELVLVWDEEASDVIQNGDVIDNLQPHTNLKRLSIIGFGGSRFSTWIANPLFCNLRVLKLRNCKNCLLLSPTTLFLCSNGMKGIERVGSEFYASSSIATKPSFPSLEILTFEHMDNWEKWLCCGCRRGEFPRLRKLYMWYCPKLVGKLPKQLRSLKKLQIVECPQLLVASLRAPAINELVMVNCGKLLLKRPAIGFTALRNSHIQISSIRQWEQLPDGVLYLSVKEHDSVETLIEEELLRSNTTCLLQSLVITYSGFSRSLHGVGLPNNALRSLEISHCSKLEFFLPVFLRCHHPFLEKISLFDNTSNSLSLSFTLSIFPKLHCFRIRNLEGLESLSISLSWGDQLELDIDGCPDLVFVEFPAVESGRYYISGCRKLKLLAVAHTLSLSSLGILSLRDCPELLFHRDGLPSNLRELQILSCNQLTSDQVDWGLQRLASLTRFRIRGGCQEVRSFPKEWLLPTTIATLEIEDLPNLKSLDSKGLQHLTSLTTLSIRDCPELESLTVAGLHHLISLKEMWISNCSKLQSLTKERLPNSLSSLYVYKCPLLEHRCQFGKGQDWGYIAHIPRIIINRVLY